MKRIAPIILVAAVALIAVGMFLSQRDPAVAYTENREAWAAYQEGEALLHAFRYSEADSMLQVAIALDPGLSMAHVALAELNRRLGVHQSSQDHYAVADSLTYLVSDEDARLLLAVRLSLSDYSRFHSHRDSLLAEAKDGPLANDLIVLLVDAEIAKGNMDYDRAEELYDRILKINPNYAAAYNFLGYLYLGQGNYDEAETAMRRYAFVAPGLANPHDSLGEVLMTVGRYEEAEVEFRTALAKDPLFFYSQRNIGWVYLMRGQVDSGLELLDRVHAEIAGSAVGDELEFGLIDHLFQHRLTGDLETYAQRYLADNPDHKREGGVRLRYLLGTGQTAAATVHLDSMKSIVRGEKWYGTDATATARTEIFEYRYRALAAEQAGAHGEAARLFREVLERLDDAPPHYKVFDRIHLAYNLIPLKAYDEARVQVAEALRVNPRIAEGVLVAASIEAAAGQVTEARRLLDSVERVLERADADYPVLIEARSLRDQLPDPDRI